MRRFIVEIRNARAIDIPSDMIYINDSNDALNGQTK